MVVGDRSLSFCGGYYGGLNVFCELGQDVGCARERDAPSRPDEGALCLREHRRGSFDSVVIGRERGVVLGLQEFHVVLIGQGVPGDLEFHGAGPSGLEHLERLMNGMGNLRDGCHPCGPLGDWTHHVQLVVDFVESAGIFADLLCARLPRHE